MEDEKKDIQEVETAFNSKDPDVIYQKIHYLKGTFTYLKAARILEITQQILNLCKEEKVDEALELRDMFVVEFDMFIDELVQYYKTL